jgi:hypothetical protein
VVRLVRFQLNRELSREHRVVAEYFPRNGCSVFRGSAVLDQVVDGLGVFVEGVRAVEDGF